MKLKMKNKGQFFIMSIVLIALAIFILISYYMTIDETTAVRIDSSSRIQIKNIQNLIDDTDNCQGNITLCDHFKDVYGGKFKLTCSTIGEGAPYNYSISFDSTDTHLATTLTQDIYCAIAGCTDSDNDNYNTTASSECGIEANIDCDDSELEINPGVTETAIMCKDNTDNDCDNNIDCADDGCNGHAGDEFEHLCEFGTESLCEDTFDNDADGYTDGDDPDCGGGGGG